MVYVFTKNKHDQSDRIFKNMAIDGIWNDLELQRKSENNISKECILTVFETIWNSREHFKNIVSKPCTVNHENSVSKAYIVTVF